jgi:hypothetical protein
LQAKAYLVIDVLTNQRMGAVVKGDSAPIDIRYFVFVHPLAGDDPGLFGRSGAPVIVAATERIVKLALRGWRSSGPKERPVGKERLPTPKRVAQAFRA